MATRVPQQIRDLYDEIGRVDAHSLAVALGENVATITRAFHVAPRTVRKNPVTSLIQEPGQRLVGMLDELSFYYAGNFKAAIAWMRKPDSDLENLSPLDLIKEGDLDVVASMIRAIGMGEPG